MVLKVCRNSCFQQVSGQTIVPQVLERYYRSAVLPQVWSGTTADLVSERVARSDGFNYAPNVHKVDRTVQSSGPNVCPIALEIGFTASLLAVLPQVGCTDLSGGT